MRGIEYICILFRFLDLLNRSTPFESTKAVHATRNNTFEELSEIELLDDEVHRIIFKTFYKTMECKIIIVVFDVKCQVRKVNVTHGDSGDSANRFSIQAELSNKSPTIPVDFQSVLRRFPGGSLPRRFR